MTQEITMSEERQTGPAPDAEPNRVRKPDKGPGAAPTGPDPAEGANDNPPPNPGSPAG
jgi:hypothetical protein